MAKQRDMERLRRATEAMEAWNARYMPGQLVEYKSHPEAVTATATHTRSQAFVVDDEIACVSLKGVQGIAAICNCKPVVGSAAAEFNQAAGLEPTPAQRRRQRLQEKLTAMAIETDLVRGRIRAALQAIAAGRSLEYSLETQHIERAFDALTAAAGDLHLSEAPTTDH